MCHIVFYTYISLNKAIYIKELDMLQVTVYIFKTQKVTAEK